MLCSVTAVVLLFRWLRWKYLSVLSHTNLHVLSGSGDFLHFKCTDTFKVKKISSVLLLINFYLSSWPLNNFFIPCFDLADPSILINTLLYINCFCLDFQHFEQLWSRSDIVPKPLIMWVTGFESSSCQSWKWRNAFRYCLNELPHSLKPADHRWVKLFINVLFYIDAYFNLW